MRSAAALQYRKPSLGRSELAGLSPASGPWPLEEAPASSSHPLVVYMCATELQVFQQMMNSHPRCFPFVVSTDGTFVSLLTPLKDGHTSVRLAAFTPCQCVHFHNRLFVVQEYTVYIVLFIVFIFWYFDQHSANPAWYRHLSTLFRWKHTRCRQRKYSIWAHL